MEFETITLKYIKSSKYNPRTITPEEQEKLEKNLQKLPNNRLPTQIHNTMTILQKKNRNTNKKLDNHKNTHIHRHTKQHTNNTTRNMVPNNKNNKPRNNKTNRPKKTHSIQSNNKWKNTSRQIHKTQNPHKKRQYTRNAKFHVTKTSY